LIDYRNHRTRKTTAGRLGACKWHVAVACFALLLAVPFRSTLAQTVLLPAELQAELLAKLLPYDRSFEERAGGQSVVVLIAVRPRDAESSTAAAMLKSALSRIDRLGKLPHRDVVVTYEGPQGLAARCRNEHASVVYVTPGFDDQIEALGAALTGVDVLSVSAVSNYVPRGIVLGFELTSGKPKLVLNLPQARKQNVNFGADVLNLMRVYR
jgi:hypothetical protein